MEDAKKLVMMAINELFILITRSMNNVKKYCTLRLRVMCVY